MLIVNTPTDPIKNMKVEPEISKRNNMLKSLFYAPLPPSQPISRKREQNVVNVNKPLLLQIERDTFVRPKATEVCSYSSPVVSEEEKESSSLSSSESSRNATDQRPKQNIIILKPSSHNAKPRPKRWKKKSRHEGDIPGLKLAIMADSEFSLGNIESAFVFWDQALQLQRHTLGDRHDVVAQTLSRRGMAFARIGHLFEATLDLEKAVHIKEDKVQENSNDNELIQDAAETLIQIARLQQERGYYVEAMQGLSKALLLKQGIFGMKHESIASIICMMGNFYHRRRRYQDALKMYNKGLALYKEVGIPKTHPRVKWVRRCLSDKNILAIRSIWSSENKYARDI